ncbi:TIM-barrel domain-containing protein [Sphingomonas sp. CROZ-RG-20F-R02-07]|uniref:glycoside hydrolase family 31 protein n=1 Tax=Sphingomonas sp. CROZ-RG-20F-R02-07 TaxID=2914832 RepID=UPI001F5AE124|nr:TIM-barrel domain-containing protein [Sphingomonas sp. CROZ-RG-20F-R02-07]
MRGRHIVLLAAMALTAASASARTTDRYTVAQGGVVLEITAPRDDIVRVRAGHPALPEDASWAVPADVRAHRVPFTVVESGDETRLTTAAITVTLDRIHLRMTIADRAGHVLLDDAPGDALAFDTAGGFHVRKAMPNDAHFFGLGDKTGPLDRRGGAFTLWNSDSFGFGPATDPLYKSVPFVIGLQDGGTSFGLFLDDTWRSNFDFGKAERDTWSFGAEGGPLDYYVMAGAGPKAIVQDYTYLTGRPPLTPLWALGFQQSHWSYMTQGEVQGIADRLRRDHIPADALWLDIDYQDRDRPFTVDTKAFPDLPGLVRSLATQDLHLVAITDLHIADAPGQGYAAYDSGNAADIFVKRPDGRPYVGPVWPGPSVFPDFSRPKARAWWGNQFRALVGMGVSGFWNDMNEPSVFDTPTKTMPLDVRHRIEEPGFAPRTATHAEMHNVYGLLNTRATYEGVLALAPDRRPFVMTRASYAGGQRYAATWTGDNLSSWAHLNLSTTQLISLGLSGFAYAGDDIGGFAGDAPSPELLTRWIEVGAFNPIFRDHYQKDKPAQEVWVHGPEQEAIRRRYIEERYRLLPYLYALADENSRTGLPLMRPVFLDYPGVVAKGDHLGGTEQQFMLGDDLLVAPPPTPESPAAYTNPLPGSGWYDYWTGQRISAAATNEKPTLDRLAVFVRPGAIVPRQPLVQATGEVPKGNLALGVYPGADCRGSLYLDDGVSFAYRHGDYLRQRVTCDATHLVFAAREGRFHPWWHAIDVTLHAWTSALPHVAVAGRPVPARVDANAHTLLFTIPDMPHPTTVTIGG